MAPGRRHVGIARQFPPVLRRHARQIVAVIVGIIVWMVAPSGDPITRLLIAWNAGAWLFIALALKMMAGATTAEIRHRAGVEDEGRTAVLVVTIAAAVASIVAIVAQMHAAQNLQGTDRLVNTGLALVTIFGSWLLVHFVFALHYAHAYYVGGHAGGDPGKGLQFSGNGTPDYWDFLYFSLVVGTTAQTSDTGVTSHTMRRVVMVHGLLSFLFNTAVIALTVNIAAQLIQS
jgi:uncharacterized membrane protein